MKAAGEWAGAFDSAASLGPWAGPVYDSLGDRVTKNAFFCPESLSYLDSHRQSPQRRAEDIVERLFGRAAQPDVLAFGTYGWVQAEWVCNRNWLNAREKQMLAIKNNLMATGAARHLGRSYDALAKSVERLSSGLRINSSKDDAAGLAVRELIRADIAVLNQGSRNASDGISMLQTGEGAMAVIDELLIRMKELAEQAATDSYSSDQRTIMNNEYQQLALEITRIAQTTTFNGNALLNSSSTFEIHIGSTDTIDIVAQVMDADTLGLGTAGTKVNYSSVHNVANANAAGWTSQAGGDDLDIRIKFTSGANTDITLTTGVSYSLNQIASMVNVASLATADAYNMASTVYNSDTNMYTLKLTGPATGSGETMAITKTAGTAALTAELDSVAGDFGVVAGTDSSGASKVDTKANAVTALTTLGTAINTKDTYRAKLGYLMNRLESAVTILDIQAENLLAAESRISDVDVATETAALTRNQVLAQAGISMLAQANTMPQMALNLLA